MTKPNITERKSCNMFQNNYTENSFLFKGLILKNLKIDEITETVIAQVEMPVKEHNCPHCGNITTYIKDYRIQKIRDLPIIDKPLIVFSEKDVIFAKFAMLLLLRTMTILKGTVTFLADFI